MLGLDIELKNWERCGFAPPTIASNRHTGSKLKQLRYAKMSNVDMSWVEVDKHTIEQLSIIRQALSYGVTKEQIEQVEYEERKTLFIARAKYRGLDVDSAIDWINQQTPAIPLKDIEYYLYMFEHNVNPKEFIGMDMELIVWIHRLCRVIDADFERYKTIPKEFLRTDLEQFIMVANILNVEQCAINIDGTIYATISYDNQQRDLIKKLLWLGIDPRNISSPNLMESELMHMYREIIKEKISQMTGVQHGIRDITSIVMGLSGYGDKDLQEKFNKYKQHYRLRTNQMSYYSMINSILHEKGDAIYRQFMGRTLESTVVVDMFNKTDISFLTQVKRINDESYSWDGLGVSECLSLHPLPGFVEFIRDVCAVKKPEIRAEVIQAYAEGYDPEQLKVLAYKTDTIDEFYKRIEELGNNKGVVYGR